MNGILILAALILLGGAPRSIAILNGTLAAAISTALASSAVTGLEALGVIADWDPNGYNGPVPGGTTGLYSTGTGIACGVGVVNGVLDRSGFPANSSGGVLSTPLVTGVRGTKVSLPAYASMPTTLVCASCLAWSTPATPACSSVAHRYSGASAANSTVSYNLYGNPRSPVSGATLTVPDAGASALLPLVAPLSTGGALPTMQVRYVLRF